MYVREKVVRRGEREYRYYQLVQSTWVGGKSRQTVVRHLGPWGNREAADAYARKAGYLCGAEGCTQEGVDVEEVRILRQRGKRKGKLCLCAEHASDLKAGATLKGREYDPEQAERYRDLIRRPPAGGRPRFQPQDRSPAL